MTVMAESKQRTITVEINGDEREVPSGMTVGGLLSHLELHERLVVVERNREILRRNEYAEIFVEAGDRLELVHFVGGG